MLWPAYGFVTYLMEYGFTFTFASWEIPWCVYALFLTALIGLLTFIIDLLTSI